jgi:hypothetical protein
METGGSMDLFCLVHVQVAADCFHIDNGGLGRLRELQDDERAELAGVSTGAIGHDLQCDVVLLAGRHEVVELGAHHRSAADHAADRGLVKNRPQLRPVLPGERALPRHPDFHAPLHVFAVEHWRAGLVREGLGVLADAFAPVCG